MNDYNDVKIYNACVADDLDKIMTTYNMTTNQDDIRKLLIYIMKHPKTLLDDRIVRTLLKHYPLRKDHGLLISAFFYNTDVFMELIDSGWFSNLSKGDQTKIIVSVIVNDNVEIFQKLIERSIIDFKSMMINGHNLLCKCVKEYAFKCYMHLKNNNIIKSRCCDITPMESLINKDESLLRMDKQPSCSNMKVIYHMDVEMIMLFLRYFKINFCKSGIYYRLMDLGVDCETITRMAKPNNYDELMNYAIITHNFEMVDHLLEHVIIHDYSLLNSLKKGIDMIMYIDRQGKLTTMMDIVELLKIKISHHELKILLDNTITTLNQKDYENVFDLCINRNMYYHLKTLMTEYSLFHHYCNDIVRLLDKKFSGKYSKHHTITWLLSQNIDLLSKGYLSKIQSSKVAHEMRRQHFYADKKYSLHYHCVHGNVDMVKTIVAKMKKVRK